MLDSPLLPVHIAGGIVGMLTGTAADAGTSWPDESLSLRC